MLEIALPLSVFRDIFATRPSCPLENGRGYLKIARFVRSVSNCSRVLLLESVFLLIQ